MAKWFSETFITVSGGKWRPGLNSIKKYSAEAEVWVARRRVQLSITE